MKRSMKKKLWYLIRKPLPILKKTVFFESFGGQYNDNPKYLSEKLHEIDSNVKIVWAISDKSTPDSFPDYITTVKMDSSEYIKYSCRSQVLVTNMNGFRGFVSATPKPFIHKILSSNRQLSISTWHGTPLKRVGLDIPSMKEYRYICSSSDYITAGCEYTRKIFEQAFNPTKIRTKGTPRNDILVTFHAKENLRIKKLLGLPDDKKIILFAPTFRQSVYESGIRQIESLNFERLFSTLSKAFGGNWCFVFRVHHEVMKQINVEELCSKYGRDKFLDGNLHDDMAQYLSVTDVLLTDYSSSLFDFALTGRPCFLLTMDREHYIEEERGLYISLDELPYPYADSCDLLYNNILNYEAEDARKKISNFLVYIGNKEDGKASERIVDDIIQFIRTGNKPK